MLYHCFYLRTVLVYETCSGTKLAYINICSRFLIQIFIRFGVGSHANPQIIIGCVSSPQRNWRCTLLPFATCVCASSFSIQIALDFFSLGQLQLFGTCKRAVTGPWKCSPFLTPSNSRSQFFGHKLWVPSINNMWIVRLIYLPAHDDAFEANAQRISSALKPFIEQYVDEIRATKDGYSCSCRKSPWPLLYINVPRPGFCYHWHHWGAAEGGKSFKKNLSSYCWYQCIYNLSFGGYMKYTSGTGQRGWLVYRQELCLGQCLCQGFGWSTNANCQRTFRFLDHVYVKIHDPCIKYIENSWAQVAMLHLSKLYKFYDEDQKHIRGFKGVVRVTWNNFKRIKFKSYTPPIATSPA